MVPVMMRESENPCAASDAFREGSSDTCYAFVLAAMDRLNREKADLLEEVRQLRAAVSIYRRIAEQATADRMASRRKTA